ncbi:hypothetical protein [Microbacterium gorillae]|uniref:hypothetical protein n=1 Tax=Microbacterium gorillae TaxID=1231063 RepID=UPI003D99916F
MTGKPQMCTADGCERKPVARRLCRAHYQAAWKAGTLGQHQKLPPRARNRVICPPEHKHAGSLVCYNLHQCRCTACSRHRAESDTRVAKLKAYGRYDAGLVDAEPVRQHLLMLVEFGIGYKRVAALSGVGITGVRNIIWGRQDPGPRKGEIPKRIKRENAERILAVKPNLASLAEGRSIPSRGAHRRLQALVARGWSLKKLAARIGVSPSNMTSLMKRDRVTVATHRAVAAVYDELWDVTPPKDEWRDSIAYSRALCYARDRRWLPPMAWDDIDNDAEPPAADDDDDDDIDETAVELAVAGERVRLKPAERREAVTRLHAQLYSDQRIAETLHCADKTVLRIRQELNLEAIDFNSQRQRRAA